MRLIKEYCCCAIPLLNAGIYTTLTEQFVVSVTAGILTLVTPPIVGASVPAYVPVVLAVLCFLAAVVQLFGFLGVFRESTVIFRRYTTLHLSILLAIFSFSAVFIGISASKHSTASANCVATFFAVDPTVITTPLTGSATEGKLLCNIFTWVGVGTMGGLWVVLGLFHVYLFFVVSGYGSSQRDDHSKYYSLYSLNSHPGPTTEATFPADHIGMHNMAGGNAWDTRDSMDAVGFEKPKYDQSLNDDTYHLPRRQHSAGTWYPDAHTVSLAPTPAFHNAYNDPYNNNAGMTSGGSEPSMSHPGR